MCVIVLKEKGQELPSKQDLKSCFDKNPHGAGFMYNKDNQVIIEKGFMEFKNLWERLNELSNTIDIKNHSMVIHFRISTSGNVDEKTCHPYPISNKKEDLQNTKIQVPLGVAHNGVIGMYSGVLNRRTDLNDTQQFILYILSAFFENNEKFYTNAHMLNAIYEMTNTDHSSKFAFLDSKGNIETVGRFEEHNGYRYSNLHHVPKPINNVDWFNKWEKYGIYDNKNNDVVDDCCFDYDGINLEEVYDDVFLFDDDDCIMSTDGLGEFKNTNDTLYVWDIDRNIYEVDLNDPKMCMSLVDIENWNLG